MGVLRALVPSFLRRALLRAKKEAKRRQCIAFIKDEIGKISDHLKDKTHSENEIKEAYSFILFPLDQMASTVETITALTRDAYWEYPLINNAKQTDAIVLLRYCFELLANVAVLLKTENDKESEKVRSMWLASRELVPALDGTWGVKYCLLPERVQGKLRNDPHIRKILEKQDPEKVVIPVDHKGMRFGDIFDKNFFEKAELVSASDIKVFFAQYRMATYVSHASYFSIWPTWLRNNPALDAVQCITVHITMVWKELGCEFDHKAFRERCFDLLALQTDTPI